MNRFPAILFFLLSLLPGCHRQDRNPATITVFAAASTTDVMKALADEYANTGGGEIKFNFAGSGALARQIHAGAPCDLYVSANTRWMDYLQQNNLIRPDTRMDSALNALVLVAPVESALTYTDFPGNMSGKLAVGDFASVPAGTYAQTALQSLGWMDEVKSELIKGSNVRTVLMYVERGEVDAGIIYLTDALQSKKVKVLGTFPADSHPAIVYPVACIRNGSEAADAFLEFLGTDEAKAIWKKYGFAPAMR